MSDGGKGSSPRPFTDKKEFNERFTNIFGESKFEKRLREESERKILEDAIAEDEAFQEIAKRNSQ